MHAGAESDKRSLSEDTLRRCFMCASTPAKGTEPMSPKLFGKAKFLHARPLSSGTRAHRQIGWRSYDQAAVGRYTTSFGATAWLLLSLSAPAMATPSDPSVRVAVEAFLTRQWQQIGAVSGKSSAISPSQQGRSDEIRSSIHLTSWTNGDVSPCDDGVWKVPVSYQVEAVAGGVVSHYRSTATAVLRRDDPSAWSAVRLEDLHVKGGVNGGR
jgi:hypothetical protein